VHVALVADLRAWATEAALAAERAPCRRRLLGLLAYDRLRARHRLEYDGCRSPAQGKSYPCTLLCVNSHKPGP
jgi:hypothetical protein